MHTPLQVIALGEILWDVFPDGPRFGGAPANFACHFAALTGEAQMVSQVGTDELGRHALNELRRRNVTTDFVAQTPEFPTGTVTVEIDSQGHASYTFGRDEAWDHLRWSEDLAALAASADAICFGTLAQRSPESRDTIRRFVKSTPENCLRILDINLRAPFYNDEVLRGSLELANVLKLNEEELTQVARLVGATGAPADQMRAVEQEFQLQLIALTRGENGAVLSARGRLTQCEAARCEVVDTVGAGDAFTAALVYGMLRQDPPERIAQRACELAAFVCTQPGGTPPIPAELRQRCGQ